MRHLSCDVDTFINGPPNVTTENEPENQNTTLASSTNNELWDVQSTDSIYNRQRTSSDSAIAAAATLGAIACISCFMTIILLVILIMQRRKRNHGISYYYAILNHMLYYYTIYLCACCAVLFTDGGPAAYSKPRKSKNSKRNKPTALPCTMATNPIYEGHGPVYEITPGEVVKSIMSPISSIPSTPADITPRYFDMPPSLPPPRNGSVAALPKLDTVDEIDAIKASIKDTEIPQSGEESQYMIMNGAKSDGKMDLLPGNGHVHDADKRNAEDVYTMMK